MFVQIIHVKYVTKKVEIFPSIPLLNRMMSTKDEKLSTKIGFVVSAYDIIMVTVV